MCSRRPLFFSSPRLYSVQTNLQYCSCPWVCLSVTTGQENMGAKEGFGCLRLSSVFVTWSKSLRSAQLSHLSHRDIKVPSSGVAVRIKSICITVLNTLHTTGIHYSQRRHCCGSQTDKGLPESPPSILSCPWPPDPLLSCL